MVVCSFGDASANHSTAAGAINTALNAAYRGLPVPILFVCEDNGWGISVPTAAGLDRARRTAPGPGLDYVAVDGCRPGDGLAVDHRGRRTAYARTRRPVFLHLRTVRFLGHAGSDAEIAYRRPRDIEADYARDPLLGTARVLVGAGRRAGEIVLAATTPSGPRSTDEAERLPDGAAAAGRRPR